jgi:hypothetical protein
MAPPKLTKDQIAEIVTRYAAGQGDAPSALATAYGVEEAVVNYHLKKNGVLVEAPAETDAALGIDQDEVALLSTEALLSHPQFKALLESAVSARLEQMHVQPAPAANHNPEFAAFIEKLERIVQVTQVQQPGYIKPLTAEEVDRRAKGRDEMFGLIEYYRAKNTAPHYLLGENWYANAILFEAGTEVRTFLPPAESMRPMNEPAAKIMAAMTVWLGGPTPDIGDLLAQAIIESKAEHAPMVGATESVKPMDVEVVTPVKRDVAPKRILGSIVPEQHGTSMPRQPGVTVQPVGPVFVEP